MPPRWSMGLVLHLSPMALVAKTAGEPLLVGEAQLGSLNQHNRLILDDSVTWEWKEHNMKLNNQLVLLRSFNVLLQKVHVWRGYAWYKAIKAYAMSIQNRQAVG